MPRIATMTATGPITVNASQVLRDIDRKRDYAAQQRDRLAGQLASPGISPDAILCVVSRNIGDFAQAIGKVAILDWYAAESRANKSGDFRETMAMIGRKANVQVRQIAEDRHGVSSDAARDGIDDMERRGRARAWVEIAEEVEWMMSGDGVELIDDITEVQGS